MAITIRDLDNHKKMIDELKTLSSKGTASGALIEGGYLALKYHEWLKLERIKTEKLQRKLYKLEGKVDAYLSALSNLRES